MPSIQSLTSSLGSYTSERKTDAYLHELGKDDRPDPAESARLAFQYFPESVSDTKAVNYQQKEIPGGSLPLYQWINGGERLITFTAVFTSDVDLISATPPGGLASVLGGSGNIVNRLKNAGEARRNVDIRSAVAWLRRYMLPTYGDGGKQDARQGAKLGVPLTFAPAKLLLFMPKSGIGLAGGSSGGPGSDNSVLCVMTQCDITYEKFFPSGLPRVATVGLSFAQVAQFGGRISFPRRDDAMDEAVFGLRSASGYTLGPRTKNGGT